MTKTSQSFLSTTNEDFDCDRNEYNDFFYLLVDDLKQLYWFEKSFLKVVTRMKKASGSTTLNNLFADYLISINLSLERLEQIFIFSGELPGGNKNNLDEEFLNDVNNILIETKEDDSLRNEGLFLVLKKLDELKSNFYQKAITLATGLDNDEVISLLEENKCSVLPAINHL